MYLKPKEVNNKTLSFHLLWNFISFLPFCKFQLKPVFFYPKSLKKMNFVVELIFIAFQILPSSGKAPNLEFLFSLTMLWREIQTKQKQFVCVCECLCLKVILSLEEGHIGSVSLCLPFDFNYSCFVLLLNKVIHLYNIKFSSRLSSLRRKLQCDGLQQD